MNLTGKIYFEETQNVTPEGIKKNSVMIDKLYVKAGDYVEAGTLIADATLSNDYESTIKEAQDRLPISVSSTIPTRIRTIASVTRKLR